MPFRHNKRGSRQTFPSVPLPDEPEPYEGNRDRAMIRPEEFVPGNREDLVGGFREHDTAKNDTVLLGHPEAAGQFEVEYDRDDPHLEGSTVKRRDLNYVSPEEIRRRSRGHGW